MESKILNSTQPTAATQEMVDTVAYTMSRFPKLTETFILYEMIALEEAGVRVELFPLLKENQDVHHQEVAKWMERAHFYPFISGKIIAANLRYLIKKPITYLRTIFEVLFGTISSLNFFFGALGVLPKAVLFAQEMEKLGVKHLHCHFCTHPAIAGLIVFRLSGIPFSFTAHGSDLHVDQTMLGKKIAAAKRAVTISNFNKEVMVSASGESLRNKIDVIHCGVDPDLFQCHDRNREPGAPFQILCVASYEEVKGHKFLVDACKILNDRGVPFRCHLVGYGPLRSQVEQQIGELGLSEYFEIHGGLPRHKVLEMHALADVLILPSVPTKSGKKEGIPVVLMEGMSSCLPVVSCNISGIPELVQDGVSGILVEPKNAAAIADALQQLHENPGLRQQMGTAGREFVCREFDLKKNARKLFGVFRKEILV